MDDSVEEVSKKLHALPQGTHWLCPKQSDDDFEDYREDDSVDASGEEGRMPLVERQKIVREGKERVTRVINSLILLSFEAEQQQPFNTWFKKHLNIQLSKCEVCTKTYYQRKKQLFETLNEEHEEHLVADFAKILDEFDLQRLKTGLIQARTALEVALPEDRGPNMLESQALQALFESLCSEVVLRDTAFMQSYLDAPFDLVQSRKPFRTQDYVPALTYFLFDPRPSRRLWAMKSWMKMKRSPSPEEFGWAVHRPLLEAMQQLSQPDTNDERIQMFWTAAKLIVDRLDLNLITHSLRALDIDIYRLALDHLQFDTPTFRLIMQTLQGLIEKSPSDFWDAMGSISAASLIEMIFQNPQFWKALEQATSPENFKVSPLHDLLSWIDPFMASLKQANQPPACRAFAAQLMERFQIDRLPEFARLTCFETGLTLLGRSLRGFVQDSRSEKSTIARVVVFEIMEVISKHIVSILTLTRLSDYDETHQKLGALGMDIVRNALALDSQCLRIDYDILESGSPLQQGETTSVHSQQIWAAVINALTRNNMRLASQTLVAMSQQVGLEKFHTFYESTHVDDKKRFNRAYSDLLTSVHRVFEQISDFDPEKLDILFGTQDTASTLIAGLLAADQATYEAAIDVAKIVSAQSGRKEALRHLLDAFLATTTKCLAWTMRRIAQRQTFGSNPRMLKTSGDVIDILCNTEDGLLRSRTILSKEEVMGIDSFWKYQWNALAVIFKKTAQWAGQNEKSTLKEFCRDTMQFAEKLFDQYNLFASAVDQEFHGDGRPGANSAIVTEAGKKLLESPSQAMTSMCHWLRLRDEYLASTSARLICKLLGRFHHWGVSISAEAHEYLDQLAVQNEIRNALKDHERAELAKALEDYSGRLEKPIKEEPSEKIAQPGLAPIFSKQKQLAFTGRHKQTESLEDLHGSGRGPKPKSGTIDLENWNHKVRSPATASLIDDELNEDDGILSASSSLERYRASGLGKKQPRIQAQASLIAKQNEINQKSFREKREIEKREKAARDKAQIALLKKGTLAGPSLTAGQGSGLNGIGVKGKDHRPQKSDMMMSSESEESEDEDLDAALFGMTKSHGPSAKVLEYQANKLRAMKEAEARRPVKMIKKVRNAKDMRARLAPDLSTLHRTILEWDIFHNGDSPPNLQKQNYTMVSNTFKTPVEYQNTFKPLHLLEAWQSFLKAKEETNQKRFEVHVSNRATVDSLVELGTSMAMSDGREVGLSEADIVLLSKAASPMEKADQPHCLARVSKITRKKAVMEVTYKVNNANPLISAMVPKAKLYAVKVTSIIPLEREYGALAGLQYYDLCDEIIRARPARLLQYNDKQIAPLVANYKVNPAQARAVKSAIDNDTFTLIQGPPGSGKTKTIIAIVGALLTNSLVDKGSAVSKPGQSTDAKGNSASPARKLLVCAPSNAAVDELVMRFKDGVKTLRGEVKKVSLVRLGRSDAINVGAMDVTLEELVNTKLNLVKRPNHGDEIHKLVEEHKELTEVMNSTRSKLDEKRTKGEDAASIQHDFDLQKRKRAIIGTKIDELRDKGQTAARDADINKRKVQQEILDGADVICATLSGSGHDMFQNLSIEFETVIIDEAAQCVELSALIPLKYGCSKCILVGDPKQLPPTVLSREAARFQYEQSLFVRMQMNHPNDVHLLDTQYRMHPEISQFPSKAFYEGKLLDGPNMAKMRMKPWHANNLLGPYRFFDVEGQQQRASQGHSLINVAELEIAVQLYERLRADFKGYDFKGKVGIITPYRSQLRELRFRFAKRFGDEIFDTVEFNTTDAFQGRESEIIIFSCVRAAPNQRIGFLDDIRRMNVGLTRAKSSLWVLGNAASLNQSEYWGGMIQDAKTRGVYSSGDIKSLLRTPLVLDTEMTGMDPDPSDQTIPPKSSSSTGTPSWMPNAIGKMEYKQTQKEKPATPKLSPPEELARKTNMPSGGGNGLNPNKACNTCGSFAHTSYNCDNEAAIAYSRRACNRCGSYEHNAPKCPVKRCINCGELGHISDRCTSKNTLPKSERAAVKRSESSFKAHQRSVQENQRKRRMDYDNPQVPTIQVASKSPPPDEDTYDRNTAPRKFKSQEKYVIPKATVSKRKRSPTPPPTLETINPTKTATTTKILDLSPTSPQSPDASFKLLAHRPSPLPLTHPLPTKPQTSTGGVSTMSGTPTSGPARATPPPGFRKRREADPLMRPKQKRPRPT